jgi:UDP-N-acetylmuramyl pentapeptide phosphotransferase/UDP-N-acetylglucosamine-1-phosphate transferase
MSTAGRGARAVRALAAAAAATWVGRRALDESFGPQSPRWTRTNHRGQPISLLEGPAVALGLLAGSAAGGGRGALRPAVAGAVAVVGGAAFGLVDDLSEDTSRSRKGLRGHLGALAHGELTTGGLKVLGIGATSLVAAAVALPTPTGRTGRLPWLLDVAASGALIAGGANLLNLLDLRPGRALKAGALLALPLTVSAGAPAAAACLGATAAAAGPDLAERDMLGDGGANALGALVATAAVLGTPRPARLALLAAVVGLTVASEKVSFTAVIERTPGLRSIDAWGRRRDRTA